MPEPRSSHVPAQAGSVLLALLPEILHEMSQPIGVLRCGLEIAQMRGESNGQHGDTKAWLQQTNHLSELLDVLRRLTEIGTNDLAAGSGAVRHLSQRRHDSV